MSNTKAVWLCNYNNYDVTETYGIKATLPDTIDIMELYNLQKKKIWNDNRSGRQKIYKKS